MKKLCKISGKEEENHPLMIKTDCYLVVNKRDSSQQFKFKQCNQNMTDREPRYCFDDTAVHVKRFVSIKTERISLTF